MMEITNNKHTLSIVCDGKLMKALGVTDKLLTTAPDPIKPVAKKLLSCCTLLEQFHLAGHFAFDRDLALTCVGITDLSMDVNEVYKFDDEGCLCVTNTELPPGIVLSLYAGLVYITDNPIQHAFKYDEMKYADSTEAIGWKDHVVISVEQQLKKNDLCYVIVIYKKEGDKLVSFGSYNAFEDKVMSDDGQEVEVSKEVADNFRRLYGKGDTLTKIKRITGNKEDD